MLIQNKNWIISALMFCVIITITGCGTVYRTQDVINKEKPYADTWKVKQRFTTQPGDYDYYINPDTFNPTADRDPKNDHYIKNRSESLYSLALAASEKGDTNTAQIDRNTLQDAIIGQSISVTKQHLAGLKATQNSANIIMGAAALGLTGAAAVAGAETAKALAAAAVGVGGARALFDDQTYRNALIESLIGAILSDQQNFYNNFIIPKQALPLTKYNMEAAINDAIEYNNRGSFYYGMQLIQNDITAANNNRTNNAALKNNLDAVMGLGEPSLKPVVAISSPTSGQVLTNATFLATGTAIGNAVVTNVLVSLNDSTNWIAAKVIGTNWTVKLTLTATTNTIAAYAMDNNGNNSLTNRVGFYYPH